MNEHVVLDIKTIQKDRAATMPGYRLITFDEMEIDPPAKQWPVSYTHLTLPTILRV